ncbi:hypothetical protein C2I18_19505 [Paenibacillus sp. PK3_47]|uniref:hypothetical protein n=1 Tax=Paenibacillus sp. PK3_47 TaxID=2072642 RepID=UPI00201E6200|nr:hypothetical protein [Paenibacillus sp. PK3_47]UQZ35515.1 hypothetical protein C2I18_19505 [Paenibacillus sp. PK3_47]
MKDNKEAPLDGRSPGAHRIPEPDTSLPGDKGATGKLEEIVGAMAGDKPEVTAPGIAPDHDENKDTKGR